MFADFPSLNEDDKFCLNKLDEFMEGNERVCLQRTACEIGSTFDR